MQEMNYKRWLAGGLVAGIVFIIGDALYPLVFSGAAEAWLAEMGFEAPAGLGLAMAMLMMLLAGLAAVWIYAGIRTRFGPGMPTAMKAGLVVWVLAIVVPSGTFATLGMSADSGFWFYMAWWLIFALAGTAAGAWTYQEVEERAGAHLAPAVDD